MPAAETRPEGRQPYGVIIGAGGRLNDDAALNGTTR
jgi:hypothetical protein